MNYGDIILLAIAGLFYFRAMVTTTRDFRIWKHMVGVGSPVGPADIKYFGYVARIGQVRLLDVRCVVLTALSRTPSISDNAD